MRLQRGGSLRRFVPTHVPPNVSKRYFYLGGSLARFRPTPYTGIGGGLALPESLQQFTPAGIQKTIKKRANANAVVDAVTTTLNKRAKKKICFRDDVLPVEQSLTLPSQYQRSYGASGWFSLAYHHPRWL